MTEYLDKAIRPLVSIMPKKSGYVKTFKFKEGNNKLTSVRINNEKLLGKYNTIWTKSEDSNCAYKIVNKQMTDYLDGNFLNIRDHKYCITIELIEAKELILLKVTTTKNAWISTIFFFNHWFSFQDYVWNGSNVKF